MTSKLPNLLLYEAYQSNVSFIRRFVGIALFYAVLRWLLRSFETRPLEAAEVWFRTILFSLTFAVWTQLKADSQWKTFFFDSGAGKLVDPPLDDCLYQLVCDQGIIFFCPDRIRFVPVKWLWRRFGAKSASIEFSPLKTVTARVIGSPSKNWLEWWPRIEISSTTSGPFVVRVPDALEAVAQIGRAVETLSSRAR